jgi:dihydrofolate reductase
LHNENDTGVGMAKLIYSAITSLDGYVEDTDGKFEWASPDEEVHAFVNSLERPIATYLYGRRMYDTMAFWETAGTGPEDPAVVREYAEIWRAAEKIVYSRTLQAASSARTRIERDFSPGAIRQLKSASRSDVTIGGSELAGQAIAAGLVDEYQLFLNPVVVGGGKRALPDRVRADLELVNERRFEGGVVYLHYRISV